jgi:hypothetical protein
MFASVQGGCFGPGAIRVQNQDMDAYGEGHTGHELDFDEREVVLRADLGDRDDRDCIWTSLRFLMRGPRPPRAGEVVLLVDVGGGSCMGRVVSVSGWEACIHPDWRTWSSSGSPPPAAT